MTNPQSAAVSASVSVAPAATATPGPAGRIARVGLVGMAGYSQVHLAHLRELQAVGLVQLAGVTALTAAEQAEARSTLAPLGTGVFPSLEAMLAAFRAHPLDLCVIPSPLHYHAPMTRAALAAGSHVLVEKPIAPTVAEVDAMIAAARAAQRTLAVGFQYLHAPEVRALKRELDAGTIGQLREIRVRAAWPRGRRYYQRNAWAGRARLGPDWVLDSPVHNAMAHFFTLMLHLATPPGVAVTRLMQLSAELYRAQTIESFDTALLRFTGEHGCRFTFGVTHSSAEVVRPSLTLVGSTGRGEWLQDSHATLERADGGRWHHAAHPEPHTRECMLRDVIAHLAGQPAFIAMPELAREHTRCVNALHEHVPIVTIPGAVRQQREAEGDVFTYVGGLDAQLLAAAQGHGSLREAGATWATTPTHVALENYAGLA